MSCLPVRFYIPAFLVVWCTCMLKSGYGIKFFIDCDGNYSDDNDDDIDESHNDG